MKIPRPLSAPTARSGRLHPFRAVLGIGVVAILLYGASTGCSAAEFRHVTGLFGEMRQHLVRENESLLEIARAFDLGYNAIVAANPGLDPFVPPAGARVTVPTAWILPDVPEREGIVVNLAEMRLYYFAPWPPRTVLTFPLGIGDAGQDTPLGTFTVIEKTIQPSWHVPASIRREKPDLPAVVPPGPDNPLGSHALRLSSGTVLIHGTNRPWGIGRRVSHGCLRLYPEDIVRLFPEVGIGTPVTIVSQPVKAARSQGRVFVEVHRCEGVDQAVDARRVLQAKRLWERVDRRKLDRAVAEQRGVPVDVTRQEGTSGNSGYFPL